MSAQSIPQTWLLRRLRIELLELGFLHRGHQSRERERARVRTHTQPLRSKAHCRSGSQRRSVALLGTRFHLAVERASNDGRIEEDAGEKNIESQKGLYHRSYKRFATRTVWQKRLKQLHTDGELVSGRRCFALSREPWSQLSPRLCLRTSTLRPQEVYTQVREIHIQKLGVYANTVVFHVTLIRH